MHIIYKMEYKSSLINIGVNLSLIGNTLNGIRDILIIQYGSHKLDFLLNLPTHWIYKYILTIYYFVTSFQLLHSGTLKLVYDTKSVYVIVNKSTITNKMHTSRD